ncbi:hypothetical protein AOL_s00215g742 [Orbilia oligospora ATCC 24927]|uniref:RING-type domain-containing protein n=1 Tax=Arthrobotrys oligospora (strain ATCC 24927 / CBS 115.81 / DSM 1491) TaxID=756982 RepID=G1XUT4_ARTOA|nr:hypothetical protein AOL_s00215g742 [Orbilia oligospora ATCC 24927]EGX43133.1 hypothetical protein AOL_s00215g742 [Orbilia oligospora ATCC 24927]
MEEESTPTKAWVQITITADNDLISAVTSVLYFWFHFLLWFLPPFQDKIHILIGLEKSCPDGLKHFSALPNYTVNLFAQNGQPNTIGLSQKEDTRMFIRKAYQRYLHRKYSETNQHDMPFSINDDGVIQKVFEWRTLKQRSGSSIYNALQNCTLKNLETSISLILVWQLCKDFGTFSFPWTDNDIDSSTWRQLVEYSFFGSDRSWSPISFKKPIEELGICEIRNRIAVLGESIGWSPDIDEEIPDSEEIVAFRQEVEVTCFFCYDQKPMWQICVLHCEHASCLDCIKRNYQMCLKDTSRLPPTCCKKYPLIYTSVAADSIAEIYKLARWIATGSNPSPLGRCYNCDKDIWPGAECGDIGFCISCEKRTCLRCNIKWHDFARVDCRLGQLGGFVAMIAANKWAQCYRCGLVVERRDGCAHIKCRCGADFCYYCGGKWPRCPCRTDGKKAEVNTRRDQPSEDSGERYTKRLRAKHHSRAFTTDKKFKEVADALQLLRIIKTYQANVVREIGNLRKILLILREQEEDNLEYDHVSAVLNEYMEGMMETWALDGALI